MNECTVEGCQRRSKANGLCGMHYITEWRQRTGRTQKSFPVRRGAPAIERFNHYTEKAGKDECWIWTGATSRKDGRAVFCDSELNRKMGRALNSAISAARWSYVHHFGQIDDDLEVDHLCRNKLCVNPNHLEAVSRAENIRRKYIKPEEHRALKPRRELVCQ